MSWLASQFGSKALSVWLFALGPGCQFGKCIMNKTSPAWTVVFCSAATISFHICSGEQLVCVFARTNCGDMAIRPDKQSG